MKIVFSLFVLIPMTLFARFPSSYVVLFTHIEDNTPIGTLGSQQSRQQYMLYRSRLIAMATLARSYNIPWSLQPDWKFLLAVLLYEDSTIIPSTNNKNLLRHLKEDLGAVLDPHSHENNGYNYTDVAHLLDSVGVGATTVIGGHIWDPSLPQFQQWDRFRVPVSGLRYPQALWRGNILMGSGTPNHVNDPIVSGVWKPQDRYNYFVHDGGANIAAIGQFRGTLGDIRELDSLYRSGRVPPSVMLTSSYHIKPATLIGTGGIATIEDSVIRPIAHLRDSGMVVPTNFTALIATWQTSFNSRGYIYDPRNPSRVETGLALPPSSFALEQNYPNPFNPTTTIRYSLPVSGHPSLVVLKVFDLLGREVATLVNEQQQPGKHSATFDASNLPSGVYIYRLQSRSLTASRKFTVLQ